MATHVGNWWHGSAAWACLPVEVAPRPTLEQWAEAKGIDVGGWGERELIEIYEADCPADAFTQRRALRTVRLRQRQLQLQLQRELEPVAAEAAQGSDLSGGWFDDLTAERLKRGASPKDTSRCRR